MKTLRQSKATALNQRKTVDTEDHNEIWLSSAYKWFMFILGLSLLAWLVWRADIKQLCTALVRFNPIILVLTVAANLVTPIFRARRFSAIFNTHTRALELTGFMCILNFMNMILPLRSGEVVSLLMLKKQKFIPNITEALPRWMVLRAFDLLAILCLMLVASILVKPPVVFESFIKMVWLFFLGSILGLTFLLLALSRLPPPPPKEKSENFFRGRVWALRSGLKGISDWRMLSTCIILSLIIWIWLGLITGFSYVAFRINLPFNQMMLVAYGVLGFSILPVNAPAGIGTIHAVQVALLYIFKIPVSEALGIAIGVHSVTLLSTGIQGIVGAILQYMS